MQKSSDGYDWPHGRSLMMDMTGHMAEDNTLPCWSRIELECNLSHYKSGLLQHLLFACRFAKLSQTKLKWHAYEGGVKHAKEGKHVNLPEHLNSALAPCTSNDADQHHHVSAAKTIHKSIRTGKTVCDACFCRPTTL